MNQPSNPTRRRFLRTVAACSAAVVGNRANRLAAEEPKRLNKFAAFVKPFAKMPYLQLAEVIARLGFDGIEATVREKGQIDPSRVQDELPRLVEALQKQNLELLIMTCGFNNLQQPHAKQVLREAAKCGVKYYRPAYYRYDLKRSIPEQIAAIKPQLDELAAFNRELGLTMVYQNHSGATNFGAPLWDLHSLFKDYSVDEIAVALDIAHATIEGGLSWPVECRLMLPQMRALFVKDFVWRDRKVQWMPLGQGMVDPKFFEVFRDALFAGPISLHVEYIDDQDPQHIEQYIKAFERDLVTLKKWL